MPRIGELRHRVVLENPARAADGDGGYVETFSALAPSPVWAKIEPATASKIERLAGNTIEGQVTHFVTLRAHAGVTLKTRITFDGRRFFVRGTQLIDEINHWLVLACEEYA